MAKLIAGNWKMNLNPTEGSMLLHRLGEKVKPSEDVEVVLCPPFIDLVSLAKDLDHQKFKLGAQNMHYLDEGAYTGEISPMMLKGLVSYVILGHSERRIHFGEDDKLIAKKMAAAVRHGITAILCVGETLLEREHGLSTKTVIDQLEASLNLLTASDISNLVIAYEPVWAIGTGRYAKPDEIMPVIKAIRGTIEELYGEEGCAGLRVLYGGSVMAENAAAYLKIDGVDGMLVGGASLNYEEFAGIIKAAQA
jgi:triosephosphate isomerase (TIM)